MTTRPVVSFAVCLVVGRRCAAALESEQTCSNSQPNNTTRTCHCKSLLHLPIFNVLPMCILFFNTRTFIPTQHTTINHQQSECDGIFMALSALAPMQQPITAMATKEQWPSHIRNINGHSVYETAMGTAYTEHQWSSVVASMKQINQNNITANHR